MRDKFEELHQANEDLRSASFLELRAKAERVQQLIEELLVMLIGELENLTCKTK